MQSCSGSGLFSSTYFFKCCALILLLTYTICWNVRITPIVEFKSENYCFNSTDQKAISVLAETTFKELLKKTKTNVSLCVSKIVKKLLNHCKVMVMVQYSRRSVCVPSTVVSSFIPMKKGTFLLLNSRSHNLFKTDLNSHCNLQFFFRFIQRTVPLSL